MATLFLRDHTGGKKLAQVDTGKTFFSVLGEEAQKVFVAASTDNKKKTHTGYITKEEFNALNVSTVQIPQNFAGLEAEMVPTRLREQFFEITEVVENEDYVEVTALHIFYSLIKNNTTWTATKDQQYSGAAACRNILTNAISPVSFHVASDCIDTLPGSDLDYSRKNIVEAFLDPKNGICAKYGLSLIRDNEAFYCLKNVGYDRGFVVQNGKNLLGVERTENIENVATRVAPFGKDKDGNPIWLDNNGLRYIDSQYIDDYKEPRLEVLDTGLTIGQDGVTQQNINDKLLEAAQKRFSEDKIDMPEVTMRIEFLSLGDTEEYAQYRGLDKVYLYDIISIKDTVRGYSYAAQVIGVEHDILTGMLNSVTIGDIHNWSGTRKIATWQVPEISGENIRLKSIMLGSFAPGAIQSQDIGDEAIAYAHIAKATIESLTADALTAAKAQIHELIAGSITADDIVAGSITTVLLAAETVTADKIAANAISATKIAAGSVTAEKIGAHAITTDKLDAGAVTADKINANAVTANKIDTNDLEAINAKLGTATIAQTEIEVADINFAHIKDLNAESAYFGQAIFQEAVGRKLYVPRLAVGYAQMVGATIGDLVIQASDGRYYGIDVDMNGNVTATERTVTQGEIASGHTTDGRTLVLGTDILATDLNTENIYASHALMDEITASSINVDKLLAREAVISWLNVQDLSSNTYIRSTVGDWTSQSTITQTVNGINSKISSLGYGTVYMQPNEPSHADLTSGDIWIQTISEGTWQEIYDGYATWTEIYNTVSTWQTLGSIPKMFVWDGRRWQEMYDAMLPTKLETEIEQLAYQVSIRATKDELDAVTGEVTEFRAELTVQAEEIKSAVSATNAKAASFVMLDDPRTVYDVSLGDIWIRSDANTTDWTAIKDTYASWTEVKDTYDDWIHLLGATTYVWNGSEWVETSDRADEIHLNTLIDQTSRSITLLAEAQAEFQGELTRQSARITVTASQIRSEVETIRGTLNRKTSIIQDDGQIALSALTFDHLGESSSGIYITPTDIRVLSGGKITVAASALYVGTNNKTLDQLLAEKSDVTEAVQQFYVSSSQETAMDGSWSTLTPTWSAGKYIWTRTRYTHADGSYTYTPSTGGVCIQGAKGDTGPQGQQGIQGQTGKGIKAVEVRFKLGDSYLNSPGGAWNTWTPEVPAYVNGKYYWSWTQTTYTDNSITDLIVSEKGMNAEYDLVKSAQKTADDIINGAQKAYYSKAIQNTGISIDDTNLEINSQGNLYVNTGGAIVVRATSSTQQTPVNAVVINQTGIAVASQGAISVASGGAFTINSGGKFKITSPNFNIDDNGAVTIKGTLTAYANSVIGGWTVQPEWLYYGTGENCVVLVGNSAETAHNTKDYAMYAGASWPETYDGQTLVSTAPFRVKRNGTLYASKFMTMTEPDAQHPAGVETEINLSKYPLWKLGYNTIKSYSTNSITLSNGAVVNFNTAASVRLSGGWVGRTFTVTATNGQTYSETPQYTVGTGVSSQATITVNAFDSNNHKAYALVRQSNAQGGNVLYGFNIDASSVYSAGSEAGYTTGAASVTLSGAWSGRTFTVTATNGRTYSETPQYTVGTGVSSQATITVNAFDSNNHKAYALVRQSNAQGGNVLFGFAIDASGEYDAGYKAGWNECLEACGIPSGGNVYTGRVRQLYDETYDVYVNAINPYVAHNVQPVS